MGLEIILNLLDSVIMLIDIVTLDLPTSNMNMGSLCKNATYFFRSWLFI